MQLCRMPLILGFGILRRSTAYIHVRVTFSRGGGCCKSRSIVGWAAPTFTVTINCRTLVGYAHPTNEFYDTLRRAEGIMK